MKLLSAIIANYEICREKLVIVCSPVNRQAQFVEVKCGLITCQIDIYIFVSCILCLYR